MWTTLPDVRKSVRTRPLFVVHLDVHELQIIGATPGGIRRVGPVPSGTFEGRRDRGANYDWLNRVVAIGTGLRRADGPVYSVFEVR